MRESATYLKVFTTFARNSLVRDMTFRTNFLVESFASMSWVLMNIGFYLLIFHYTPQIGKNTGWGESEFFVFLATTMLVNSLVQAFFMPNAQEFSELIRTGGLDFALLKPIDTQFLISLQRVNWSSFANFFVGIALAGYNLWWLMHPPVNPATGQLLKAPLEISPLMVLLYPFYILCGVAILYSLMITLAATSIWLGRNQTLYDFWFYITNFSRYPMEIYSGAFGQPLRLFFTFVIPVLIVVNVPARLLARPLRPSEDPQMWLLAGFAIVASIGSFLASRWIFRRALLSYRSASS